MTKLLTIKAEHTIYISNEYDESFDNLGIAYYLHQ